MDSHTELLMVLAKVVVPETVAEVLKLRGGDELDWQIDLKNGTVCVKKV